MKLMFSRKERDRGYGESWDYDPCVVFVLITQEPTQSQREEVIHGPSTPRHATRVVTEESRTTLDSCRIHGLFGNNLLLPCSIG